MDAIRAALGDHEPSQEQWDAIRAPLAPQCIVAGAGSGKTAVMAARIVWLVSEGHVTADHVLGLTFTNKASLELESRVTHALGRLAAGATPTVLTYHAFADQIVREHGARVGLSAAAALLSTAQKWQLLQGLVDSVQGLDKLELRHSLSFVPQVIGLGEECADHLLTPDDVEADCDRLADDEVLSATAGKRKDLVKILRAYIARKRQLGWIDYGDQITLAVRLLDEFPEVAGGYRERFPVVLLDEYQDTNPAQAALMALLCPPGAAVTAVGDARQAIYAWRGASMYNLIEFPLQFRGSDGSLAASYSLADNYRSGRRIVDLANRLIESVPEDQRPGKPLQPVAANGEGWVGASLLSDQDAEAQHIVDTLERLHAEGKAWSECAVLLRKRRYMDAITAVLERRDIPFEVPELGGLLKVPAVVDTIAWMHIVSRTSPESNRWVARALMGPRFRVHYRDLAPIARWAVGENSALRKDAAEASGRVEPDPGEIAYSLHEALRRAGEIDGVSDEAHRRIGQFLALVDELRTYAGRPIAEIAQVIVDRTGIADTLAASPSRAAGAMQRNLASFLGACSAFAPLEGEASLDAFLDYLDVAEESDDTLSAAASAPTDSVKVMTIHSAKGLEFNVVFLPVMAAEEGIDRMTGMQKGSVFPDVRLSDPSSSPRHLPNTIRRDGAYLPKPEPGKPPGKYRIELKQRALQDERRLLYVAVTRAREQLHCSAAWWYESDAKAKGPSQFLTEIAGQMAPGAQTTLNDGPRGDVEWVRVDERPASNPVVERMSGQLAWPPVATSSPWVQLVDDLIAKRRTVDVDISEHLRTLDEFRAGPEQPAAHRLTLSATAAARLAAAEVISSSALPRRATAEQRLGVEVHAWIEEQARGLTGMASDEEIDDPGGTPDPGAVEHLRAQFRAMGYDRRPLATLDSGDPMTELPFTLKVGEALVRGRIDAVYEASGGGLEIVDFKTGHVPDPIEWEQLELYAEALALLGISSGEVTLTYAYLRDGLPYTKSYVPRGVGWVEGLLAKA